MAEEFDLETTTSTITNDEYIGFLIFIKILALLSMIASTLIVRDVYHKLFNKGNNSSLPSPSTLGERISMLWNISLTQSILVCLSVGDFFSAFFVQFLSTWMVPSFINVAFASGTVATCTIQGICSYFFYGLSVFSNASLAVAYCCFVKFGWNDDVRTAYRLYFTMPPIVCAAVISIVPLFGQNYNYSGDFFCDISGSPFGCNFNDQSGVAGEQEECIRGAKSRQMLLYIGVIPFMVAFAIIITSLSLLIYSVFKQERRMDRFQVGVSAERAPQRKMTNQATKRGIYYVGAFGLCWIPWYIYGIVEYKNGDIPDWLGVLHMVTMPLQGALNAMVYFRPRYESIRVQHPTESKTRSWFRALRLTLPSMTSCCSCCRVCGGGGDACSNKSSPSQQQMEIDKSQQREIGTGEVKSSIEDTRISHTNSDQHQFHNDSVDGVNDRSKKVDDEEGRGANPTRNGDIPDT